MTMNKNKHNLMCNLLLLPLCLVGLALLSGCNDDDLSDPSVPETPGFVYDLNVEKVQTRALKETADKKISANFEQGDRLIAFSSKQVAPNDKNTQTNYSVTTSASTGKKGRFDGRITTSQPFTMNDELYFLFPGVDSENENVLAAVEWAEEEVGELGNKKKVNYWNKPGKVRSKVRLDMEEQDGTLETIGKKFDYQWAAGKPKSVNNNNIDIYIGQMQRLVSFLRLSFRDKEGRYLKNIERVTISNVNCFEIFDLTTGKVAAEQSKMNSNNNTISIDPAKGTFNPTEENRLYAVLFPGNYKDVVIVVYADGTPYIFTYPRLYIKPDKYYTLDVAGMVPAQPNKYVEVQGVKWATGNFIHVYNSKSINRDYPNGDYFGIAPTQWWMADYAMDNTAHRRKIGSQQRPSDKYQAHKEELDLWRYGDIATWRDMTSIESVNHPRYKGISKEWYTKGIYVDRNKTTDREKAKYGDIVYYYTCNNRNIYRYPTKAELAKLTDEANCYPAFCYTDKGNKIYGAYFTTCDDNFRFQGFPTGTRLYKYVDVTGLVMANKGLFLPITGMRRHAGVNVAWRDMNHFICYGQYMSDWQDVALQSYVFTFGPSAWGYVGGMHGQGNAIRPVWDGENKNVPARSLYPGFEGIYKVVKGDKSM